MKICIAGKNKIAVHGLAKAIDTVGLANVVVCPNQSDEGQASWQPSLKRATKEWGVREVSLSELYLIEDLLFISLEFDRIIDYSRFITRNIFNIHFSLLPAYKGVYTSAWPIINGENFSGVTLHKIDHGIDTGNIVAQLEFPIDPHETARSLYLKYLEYSQQLLDENWIGLIEGKFSEYKQPALNSSYYSKKSINYNNLNINFNSSADQVSRQIRAYSFREFQTPIIHEWFITDPLITEDRSVVKPGSIVKQDDVHMFIATIDYDLRIKKSFDAYFDLVIGEGDPKAIKNFILAHKDLIDINLSNKKGWTLLMIAAYHGWAELVELLIELGANINATNPHGTTVLMYAKEYLEKTSQPFIMNYLISSGADLEAKDIFGKTLFDYARKENQIKTLNFLKKYEH